MSVGILNIRSQGSYTNELEFEWDTQVEAQVYIKVSEAISSAALCNRRPSHYVTITFKQGRDAFTSFSIMRVSTWMRNLVLIINIVLMDSDQLCEFRIYEGQKWYVSSLKARNCNSKKMIVKRF